MLHWKYSEQESLDKDGINEKRREVGIYLFIHISPELKQVLQRSSLYNLSMAIGRADHFTIQNRYHKPQQRKG
ncbi:hypothetical protein RJ44_18430 [Alteromonas macleodii]|nr:hypothetical protein RJ44_18430 [Alteromonas macleodii]